MYALGHEFLASYNGERSGCLVLEQRIFDVSGLQIQQRLAERNQRLPMVYVTSGWTVPPPCPHAGRRNACFGKTATFHRVVQRHPGSRDQRRKARRQEAAKRRVRESIALLTRKERQLVGLVACAKSTKAIAAELSICNRAVELRRCAVMDKLGLNSSLELIRFAVLACQECSHYLECAGSRMGENLCHLNQSEPEA